ncbi:MAG: HAD family hydrolase [Candidatus Baltobacteraceae bacterium]
MSSRPPLAAVLFDLDDTLHDDTLAYRQAAQRVACDVAAERGVDAAALLAAYVGLAESFWKNLSSAHFGTPLAGVRATMWARALAAVGLEDAALAERCGAAYNGYRKDYLQLWPGALELLETLRAAGHKLGLLTNGFAETHREKIALLKLEDAFDEVFIADEIGMLKPDPRLFAFACRRLGAAPAASAMVGDRYERDIRGAHALGLFTVWVNVRDERVPAGGPVPDATVKAIGEVEGVLPFTRNR